MGKPAFQSSEELFQAVRELVADLERSGDSESAAELQRGVGCLNGLTDGWALLLESILKVARAGALTDSQRQALEAIRRGVERAVRRR